MINYENSAVYVGNISHRRFTPKRHSFNYSLFMLALELNDDEKKSSTFGVFGCNWLSPLRFVQKDYVKGEPFSLLTRIKDKVKCLNGNSDIDRVVMLAQVRAFGVYFSPANFYFCYDKSNVCTQMLAEVSNTPWNERHYYLIDMVADNGNASTEKAFQVSPFMDINMQYIWKVKPPLASSEKLLIHIENHVDNLDKHNSEKVFDATLNLNKQAFTKRNLFKTWCKLPFMTIKIVLGIYWQALKILIKRIPFIGYQKKCNE